MPRKAQTPNGAASGDHDWARAAERRNLGSSVRRLRHKQSRTLADVAGQAGISVSLLSQVERGLVAPSLDSLRNIAEALGTAPFQLLAGRSAAQVVRRQEGIDLDLSEFVEFRLLSPSFDGAFEVGRWTLSPGGTNAREARAHAGEEANYLLAGNIRLQIGDEVHELTAGDFITFDARLPHKCEVIGNEPATALFIVCPPSF
jgi:transcriptional regulator with XRE-family HTH domain